MWTFGINLLEILIGQHPMSKQTQLQLITSIQTWTPTFPTNQINLEEIQEIIVKL